MIATIKEECPLVITPSVRWSLTVPFQSSNPLIINLISFFKVIDHHFPTRNSFDTQEASGDEPYSTIYGSTWLDFLLRTSCFLCCHCLHALDSMNKRSGLCFNRLNVMSRLFIHLKSYVNTVNNVITIPNIAWPMMDLAVDHLFPNRVHQRDNCAFTPDTIWNFERAEIAVRIFIKSRGEKKRIQRVLRTIWQTRGDGLPYLM